MKHLVDRHVVHYWSTQHLAVSPISINCCIATTPTQLMMKVMIVS